MARVDDYLGAKKIAVENLSKESLADIAHRTGFEISDSSVLEIPFLNNLYSVSFPEFAFEDKSERSRGIPLQEQVLILHYLEAGSPSKLEEKWVSYREIPGATFYYGPFVKRAIEPFKKVFGQNIPGFSKAAGHLKSRAVELGDAAFIFQMFPRVPVQIILWQGDDEFPPEANIVFDGSIGGILSPEDIAWLASLLVYRLVALSNR